MRAQELVQRAQDEATPHDVPRKYEGRWVAVRDGNIIASAEDSVALRAMPGVGPDDALMLIERAGDEHILLL